MGYKVQIEEAYDRLGFKPRDNQVEHIERIVGAMLDENMRHVILSAPTGTGKSIIGAVTAEVVHTLKSPHQEAAASFLLTATNALGQQYLESFGNPDDPRDTTFRFLKGAGNFECSALSTDEERQTAENCAIRLFQKSGMEMTINEHCNKCEYQINRSLRDRARRSPRLATDGATFGVRVRRSALAERPVHRSLRDSVLREGIAAHSAGSL
jgi:Rad3-related DNA helicase